MSNQAQTPLKDEPLTWEYLRSVDDFAAVEDFLTDRQRALMLLGHHSDGVLMQMLVTNGFIEGIDKTRIFRTTEYAEWLDSHFAHVTDEEIMKIAIIAGRIRMSNMLAQTS